ncbi:MAG: hypothetical protein HY929_06550 [Euryarchaeota archaeon]|nr:hypothetical protein [Euryarchaeota archaeon]
MKKSIIGAIIATIALFSGMAYPAFAQPQQDVPHPKWFPLFPAIMYEAKGFAFEGGDTSKYHVFGIRVTKIRVPPVREGWFEEEEINISELRTMYRGFAKIGSDIYRLENITISDNVFSAKLVKRMQNATQVTGTIMLTSQRYEGLRVATGEANINGVNYKLFSLVSVKRPHPLRPGP